MYDLNTENYKFMRIVYVFQLDVKLGLVDF